MFIPGYQPIHEADEIFEVEHIPLFAFAPVGDRVRAAVSAIPHEPYSLAGNRTVEAVELKRQYERAEISDVPAAPDIGFDQPFLGELRQDRLMVAGP